MPDDHVIISTIHQAKGLEWDVVHIAGCNENILPHYRSIMEENVVAEPVEHENKDESEIIISNNPIEEERRLFYVAVTRAKKVLKLTMSESTPLGDPLFPSRFLVEIYDVDPGAFKLDSDDF
ncbi:MAG: ATP-dependent DNA helicase Rep [ANME-2 cluster archaeon HR1]|nr:MAG: ATP-dependent DNA helicase Rep [ANME-2 cluster archaeon HR1]